MGEFSCTGEPAPFQLKNDVSLFGASEMLGLGADSESFDPVVRCVANEGSAFCASDGPPPAREGLMVVLWGSAPVVPADVPVFSLRTGSLATLASFVEKEDG